MVALVTVVVPVVVVGGCRRALAIETSWGMSGVSLVTQTVKNPPAMQEIWVQFLGQENPLEKGIATHCSILAWRVPWAEDWWATVHHVCSDI